MGIQSADKVGFSGGGEKELPNAFLVNAFRMTGPTKRMRGNYLLRKFEDVDWVFVVSVIMSFAAIVLPPYQRGLGGCLAMMAYPANGRKVRSGCRCQTPCQGAQ